MLELTPVRIALPQAQETEVKTAYGSFYARMWPSVFGWLAYIVYHLGDDIQIHRNSPGLGMNEVDAAAWIQSAFDLGPRCIAPMLEDLT